MTQSYNLLHMIFVFKGFDEAETLFIITLIVHGVGF